MILSRPLKFNFSAEGQFDEGPSMLSVTYLGRVSRKAAAADAQERFEIWQRLPVSARVRKADQIVMR